jgi:uncharacterized damage-inducible protein DinB
LLIDAEPLPGYPEPYGLLCAILQDGTREWRGELDPDLPDDAVVWQPSPGAPTIGAILLHIMSVEVSWFERFVLGLPINTDERKLLLTDAIDVDAPLWPAPHPQPIRWYFDLHDGIRARTLEGIKQWPPADAARDRNGTPRTMRWVLGHVIQHEAYHGGQIVLLNSLYRLSHPSPSAEPQ